MNGFGNRGMPARSMIFRNVVLRFASVDRYLVTRWPSAGTATPGPRSEYNRSSSARSSGNKGTTRSPLP